MSTPRHLWPTLSSSGYMKWVEWLRTEPDTPEKWGHIFSEVKRDREEFITSLAARTAQALATTTKAK